MIRKRGLPFIAIGFGLMAIGLSGRMAFIAIGIAFIVIGFTVSGRSRS
ncbi:MAG TPA: hypothetical protein VM934_13090 [Pyrinomonadaceae bacterium]|jgi:mannose/fructose/N-acetylgalactosamine-specific phosphotransferase system component IIC|nr:hypothetical protein [Pyrinomonadaceae bacterium]